MIHVLRRAPRSDADQLDRPILSLAVRTSSRARRSVVEHGLRRTAACGRPRGEVAAVRVRLLPECWIESGTAAAADARER